MAEEATVEAGEDTPVEAEQETATTQVEDTSTETNQVGETTESSDDWRSGIEDEKLAKFAERFTDPKEALKTAFEFRQKLSNAVSLPGKNASEEEIKEFYSKLGVPESADGYKYDLPEDAGDPLKERVTGLVQRLHEAGTPPQAVEKAVQAEVEAYNEAEAEREKQREKSMEEAVQTLKKEWGGDYDANVEYSRRGAKQFGDDSFMEFLESAEIDGTPLGNHPSFLRVFANIGRKMGEGGLHQALSEDDKQATQSRLDDLTAKAHEAQAKGDRAEMNKLFAERDKLSKEFYGSE